MTAQITLRNTSMINLILRICLYLVLFGFGGMISTALCFNKSGNDNDLRLFLSFAIPTLVVAVLTIGFGLGVAVNA